jgi:hypothetical protein
MIPNSFDPRQLPTPRRCFRKHDFGGRDYETLWVFFVPERVWEGVPRPRIVRCGMSGTLAPEEELSAPDVETGQMLLDALFSTRIPDHQCGEGCTGGWSNGDGDETTSDEGPVTHTVQ